MTLQVPISTWLQDEGITCGCFVGSQCDYRDMRCSSADGRWQVDVITLTLTPNHHDGTWLRISEYGWHTTDVRTIEELHRYVDLADLEEALEPITPGWVKRKRPRGQRPWASFCVVRTTPSSESRSARLDSPHRLRYATPRRWTQ